MYANRINVSVFKVAVLFLLALGFVLISDTTAQAQNRRERGDRYRTYESDGAQVARQYGFEDGFEDGADAGRERNTYNPENSGDWKKGTNGYEDRFENKRIYKQAYRNAYKQGYRQGYDRYVRSSRAYRP